MVRGNTAVRAGPTTQANIAAVSLPGEPPKPVLATLSPGFKNSIIRPCTNTFLKESLLKACGEGGESSLTGVGEKEANRRLLTRQVGVESIEALHGST